MDFATFPIPEPRIIAIRGEKDLFFIFLLIILTHDEASLNIDLSSFSSPLCLISSLFFLSLSFSKTLTCSVGFITFVRDFVFFFE